MTTTTTALTIIRATRSFTPCAPRLCFCLPDISYIKPATVMRPTYTAYPLFSRKYYRPLLYSTLLYSTLIRCTDAIFFSLTPLQDDAGWAQMQGGERERGRQVTARCNCFLFSFLFYFFLLVFFFSFRSLSFLFRVFFAPLRPLFSKFTQSLHGNAKCEWRVAMRSLEGWWLVAIESSRAGFLHRWNIEAPLLL